MRFLYLLLFSLLPALALAQVPFKRSSDIVNLSSLPYTPAVLADWDGSADPGGADDAVDQLAERVDDVELSSGIGYTPADTNDWPGVDPTAVSGALDLVADRVATAEAFLARGRLVTVSATAEAAEAITLTISVADGNGQPVAGERVRVFISTDPEGTSAVNAAAFVIADAGDGTIEDEDTGNAIWNCLIAGIVTSKVVLSVTDQAASGSTLYVWVDVLGNGTTAVMSARVRTSITFAA